MTALGLIAGVGANVAIIRDKPITATILAAIEGIADWADGLIAHLTHTKGPMGKKLDAGTDQPRIAAYFITMSMKDIIPKSVAATLLLEKAAVVVPSSIALAKGNEPIVASEGKVTGGIQRGVAGSFLASWALDRIGAHSPSHQSRFNALSRLSQGIGYALLGASILTTPNACKEYINFAKKPKNPEKVPKLLKSWL